MQANDKMPPFKWVIVYFNRFIPLLIAGAGIFYLVYKWAMGEDGNAQKLITYLAVVIASFILKEVLYQSRAAIYGMGQSRFYGLLILFYLPWLVNAFMFNEFKVVPLYADISYLNNLRPLDLVHFKLLVFSPAIAVIWYIFDIEFDRVKRQEMDIKALLIEESRIQRWNHDLVIIATVFSLLVISLYSLILGLFCAFVYGIKMLLPKKIGLLTSILAGGGCLFYALNFNAPMVNLAHGWWCYWLEHGFWIMVGRQVHTVKSTFEYGVSLIAVPFLLIEAFAEMRLKPKDLMLIKQYAKENAKNISTDGEIDFGINAETGAKVKLTEHEFNYHALYLGTTGGGKTTAILNNVEHCAKKGIPCILLDGKGSLDLPAKMKHIADCYNRKFKIFSLKPEALTGALAECLAAYHPFSTGTFTEWKNRIMSLFAIAEGRGQQHFALEEEKTLNLILCMISKVLGSKCVDLVLLYTIVNNINTVKQLAKNTDDGNLIAAAEKITPEKLGDIAAVLELFVVSSYGKLFDTKENSNVIKLQESIINNEVVLFLFDSSAYKEDTKKIAKMVINDINSAFSTMIERVGGPKTCFCIFDEFASYASSNLSDTLTLHRSNGLHGIVGTQGLETFALASAETGRVAEEILACVGTYLILQLQHDKDIERVAKIIGTRDGYEITRQLDISEGQGTTGMGSSKQIKEFVVHPDTIRQLKGADGSGILYRKAYGQAPIKVILRRPMTWG